MYSFGCSVFRDVTGNAGERLASVAGNKRAWSDSGQNIPTFAVLVVGFAIGIFFSFKAYSREI